MIGHVTIANCGVKAAEISLHDWYSPSFGQACILKRFQKVAIPEEFFVGACIIQDLLVVQCDIVLQTEVKAEGEYLSYANTLLSVTL